MRRKKLSEEERRIAMRRAVAKYVGTDKGRLATRKAALKYYHKTKVLKKNYAKIQTI